MTHQPAIINRKYLAFGFIVSAFLFLLWLVKSPVFYRNPSKLSAAITVDLLLSIPAVYALLIWRTKLSKLTIFPLVMLGMYSASFILPTAHQQWLHGFKLYIFPLIEFASTIMVARKFVAVRRQFSQSHTVGSDFFDVLKKACYTALPRAMAAVLVSEISMIYYGVFHWKSRKPCNHEFTCHQKSGTPALLGCMVFLILIESTAMHLLITRWSPVVAWIFTGTSLYTALQFWGYARSLSKRLMCIEGKQLIIRYGIMVETHIHIQHIGQVELSSRDVEPNATTRKLSPLGQLESHNVILHLNRDHVLHGLFGKRHRFRRLLLHVDDKDRFKAQLEAANRT